MIDEAVAEAAGGLGGEAEESPEPVRLDVPVDAYLPAAYIPFEAAKIDVHRRIAAARRRASCGRSATSSEDRFGPPPPEVENLLALQRARIEFGLAGARSVELRGGRLSVSGVELIPSRPASSWSRSRGLFMSGARRPPRCACPRIRAAAGRQS